MINQWQGDWLAQGGRAKLCDLDTREVKWVIKVMMASRYPYKVKKL